MDVAAGGRGRVVAMFARNKRVISGAIKKQTFDRSQIVQSQRLSSHWTLLLLGDECRDQRPLKNVSRSRQHRIRGRLTRNYATAN